MNFTNKILASIWRLLSLRLLLCGGALVFNQAFGADGLRLVEARGVAMGEASVALESFRNPSSQLFSLQRGGALFSFENRYGMKELSTYGVAARYHFPFLQAGITFSRFGYERYNETFVGVDLSKRLFEQLGLGVRIHYANLFRSQEEGADEVVTVDLGLTLRLGETFTVGVLANNLFKGALHRANSTHPLAFRLAAGLAHQASEQFLVCTEVEYLQAQTLRMKVGLEYFILAEMPLRLGFTSSPLQPTFGMGYSPLRRWRLDVSSSSHTTLGFAPSLSMQYCF